MPFLKFLGKKYDGSEKAGNNCNAPLPDTSKKAAKIPLGNLFMTQAPQQITSKVSENLPNQPQFNSNVIAQPKEITGAVNIRHGRISSSNSIRSMLNGFQENLNSPLNAFNLSEDMRDPQFIVVQYLYDTCNNSGWFKLNDPFEPCVAKKSSKSGSELHYRYLPPCDNIEKDSFIDCISKSLRADVVVRVSFPVIHAILDNLKDHENIIHLDENHNIQVIESVDRLAWARKYQYCSFVRDEKSMIAWGDSVEDVVGRVSDLEKRLVDYIWSNGNKVQMEKASKYKPRVTFTRHTFEQTDAIPEDDEEDIADEKMTPPASAHSVVEPTSIRSSITGSVSHPGTASTSRPNTSHFSHPHTAGTAVNSPNSVSVTGSSENYDEKTLDIANTHSSDATDVEAQKVEEDRPVVLLFAFVQALALVLIMAFGGMLLNKMIIEIKALGTWYDLLVFLYFPPFFLFSAFFASAVVGVVTNLIGPVSQLHHNSYSYSCKKVPRINAKDHRLPHVTIQCPVYKEGLDTVLRPTFESVKKAIHTYEFQGGSANVFVNDDGLQLIDKDEALRRIEFYEENGFGYAARPAHNKNGFVRKGRFKKASNMNYCLAISSMVHRRYEELREQSLDSNANFDPQKESSLYLEALEQVVEEEGKCWAGGDILIGDLILIIDSDTKIPEDCFLDAASEMAASPEVAIIQHKSGVMMVVNDYWEQMIGWFTELIYFSIALVSANGNDTASFVGHNAFLRWSAIQEVAYVDEDDGLTKYWSEAHVSEDFEMSLKLGGLGYVVRYATYHGDEFQEGVSLSVYDELTRWSKYAYGCSEIIFCPIKDWFRGKMFTPLFSMFLHSNISYAAKLGILSYMGTYFAIAISLIMLFINYFVVGYFDWGYSKIYIDSMRIFVSVMFVFSVASQFSYVVCRFRVKKESIPKMFLEIRWTVLMSIFMGGLSWHMLVAISCHLFALNMAWEATAKDMDDSNFFKEVPKALKGYRFMYIFIVIAVAGILVMAFGLPYAYRITTIAAILPLGWTLTAHFLSPIVLNPQLTTFSW